MSPRYTLCLFRATEGEGPVYAGKAVYVLVTEKNKSYGICTATTAPVRRGPWSAHAPLAVDPQLWAPTLQSAGGR